MCRLLSIGSTAVPPDRLRPGYARLRLVVVGLDEVGEVLGLLVAVVVVAVAVVVVRGADVLHLVDAAALGATLDGAVAGDLDGGNCALALVRSRLRTSARRILQHCYSKSRASSGDGGLWWTYGQPDDSVRVDRVAGAAGVLLLAGGADQDRLLQGSFPRGIQGLHVEDVNTLHLAQNLQTLNTSGLLQVGGDGAGLGTGSHKVVDGLDVCSCTSISWGARGCFHPPPVPPRRPASSAQANWKVIAACDRVAARENCGSVPDSVCEGFSDLAGVLLWAFSADGIMSCQPRVNR
ncbi:hypothetical protein FJTKL_12137 [Diaporthe vaccinii]|uniref:Uncharacterized protein n=1 Tax=Diaporthe vaccinii TaxID=105482 RepID=A0ABR4EF04_9PEZI